MRYFLPLLVIMWSLFLVFYVSEANAVTIPKTPAKSIYLSKSQLIGIQLSQSCIIMEKNQIKSGCLTYDKLKQFDNTNSLFSGQWVNDTWYYRLAPRVHNHEVMALKPFVVMVDPNPDFTVKAKMITIQSSNFTFINPNDGIGDNHTRIEHKNRIVLDCSQAIVSPDLWLINDTINYLESNCKTTKYNDKVLVKTGNKPFSFDNAFSTLHQDYYLKTIFKGHTYDSGNHTSGGRGPSNCLNNNCGFIDPYKKQGY